MGWLDRFLSKGKEKKPKKGEKRVFWSIEEQGTYWTAVRAYVNLHPAYFLGMNDNIGMHKQMKNEFSKLVELINSCAKGADSESESITAKIHLDQQIDKFLEKWVDELPKQQQQAQPQYQQQPPQYQGYRGYNPYG